MTALPAPLNPFGQFLNLAGTGTNLGHLWIGQENTDPEEFPQDVFWDELGTIPAEQPLSVVGGYVYRDDAPAPWYTSGAFSIRLRNRSLTSDPHDGSLIFYRASVPNLADLATPGPWPFPIAWTQPTDTSPAANAWLGGFVTPWAIQLPADLFNAVGWAFTPPSGGSYVATLRKNSTGEDHTTGTAIATMTWADGESAPTFATTGGVTIDLAADDRIDWYGAATNHSINGMEWTIISYVQGDGTGAYAGLVTEAELTAAVASLQTQIDDLTAAVAAKQGYDVGDVKWFAGPSANLPSGWYALDSASVVILNISAYPALYAKIGTAWGGDGMTTFGIPPANRYPRMALTGTHAVGTLLDNSVESHNHSTGLSFTTGSTVPATYGTTNTDVPAGPHQTVHTDDNAPVVGTYTSTGSVAPGSGTGTEAGNFDTETRPDTAVFTCAIWTGVL